MRKLEVIRAIYSHPAFVLANAAAAVLYYLLFTFLVSSQNHNIFIVTLPAYVVYALVLTASVLLTVNLYSIRFVLPGVRRNASKGLASAVTVSAGTLIAGCAACQAPLAAGILYLVGFNALAVSSFLSYTARYQLPLFAALMLVNLALLYYSVSRLAATCRLRNGRLAKR